MTGLRCLVTGGAGFLGSHLVDRLLADGHRVMAMDNFFTGTEANVAHLKGVAEFELVEWDVIQPFPKLAPFDWVFNLACPASPPHYQRDPIFTTKTCFLGTLNALERAREDGARFFQASTSEIYGDPTVHPQTEEYRGSVSTLGPRACYDEGKRVAESLCSDYRRMYDLDVRIVRIFNTYGPRMDPADGRVVSNFIMQALRNESLTIHGDGRQTRSFCFVTDLVEGCMRLMRFEGEGWLCNMGNDHEYTMLELAQLVLRHVSSTSEIRHRPLPIDDPTRRRPDLSWASANLGYRPTVGLDEGLLQTIRYFRELRAAR